MQVEDVELVQREHVDELLHLVHGEEVARDVEVKQKLITALNTFLDPIRERRAEFERQPGLLTGRFRTP